MPTRKSTVNDAPNSAEVAELRHSRGPRRIAAIASIMIIGLVATFFTAAPASASPTPPAVSVITPSSPPSSPAGKAPAASNVVRPLTASGCTLATVVIKLCITVNGTGTYVSNVYTEKRFQYGYVNACDSVQLTVNGRVYLSAARWCSPTGTYLSHTFAVGEDFADGTTICVRWASYPTHQPCETIEA